VNDDDPRELVDRVFPWLRSPGEHDGIVISSRVRLARNLADRPFKRLLDRGDQQKLINDVMAAIRRVGDWKDSYAWYMEQLSPIERRALLERHLISAELGKGDHPGAVMVSRDEIAALMINEEDHLRIQCLGPGLCIGELLERAVSIDRALEKVCDWAAHERYGYLTSCPTNVGTGMRASAMLHLPLLAETKELARVLRGLGKLSMTARGLYGEGSEASGHLYQISNQRTLGLDEAEIREQLDDVVEDLVAYERLLRRELLGEDLRYEDRVHRAAAILRCARNLTTEELIDQLGWVRLGLAEGMIDDASWDRIDRIFAHAQPAHLQLVDAEAGAARRRDAMRAELVRKLLN